MMFDIKHTKRKGTHETRKKHTLMQFVIQDQSCEEMACFIVVAVVFVYVCSEGKHVESRIHLMYSPEWTSFESG